MPQVERPAPAEDEPGRDRRAGVAPARRPAGRRTGVVQLAARRLLRGDELEALRRLERRLSENGRPGPRLVLRESDPAELERLGRGDLLAGEVEPRAAPRRPFDTAASPRSSAGCPGPRSTCSRRGSRRSERGSSSWPGPPGWSPRPCFRRGRRQAVPAARRHVRRAPLRRRGPDAVCGDLVRRHVRDDVRGCRAGAPSRGPRRRALARLARAAGAVPPPLAVSVAGGLAAAFFGLLYGEFFGPTGVVPTIWVKPTEDPIVLLAAAIAVGGVLLAISYGIGIAEPVARERRRCGAHRALRDRRAPHLLGARPRGRRLVRGRGSTRAPRRGAGARGRATPRAGFHAEAGRGAAAATQATVEVVDSLIRVVGERSLPVWPPSASCTQRSRRSSGTRRPHLGRSRRFLLAVTVFLVGNALTFSSRRSSRPSRLSGSSTTSSSHASSRAGSASPPGTSRWTTDWRQHGNPDLDRAGRGRGGRRAHRRELRRAPRSGLKRLVAVNPVLSPPWSC